MFRTTGIVARWYLYIDVLFLTGLGTTSVSIIAVLCALLGSVIGFSVRHFYPAHVSGSAFYYISPKTKSNCD